MKKFFHKVTSRYMKNNPKKNAASLVRYMGTREGVELTQEGAGTQRVPTSTLRMIFKLCEKYPEIFDYPELKTFGESLTAAAAWRDLVRRNSPELAQAMGISPSKWYPPPTPKDSGNCTPSTPKPARRWSPCWRR